MSLSCQTSAGPEQLHGQLRAMTRGTDTTGRDSQVSLELLGGILERIVTWAAIAHRGDVVRPLHEPYMSFLEPTHTA